MRGRTILGVLVAAVLGCSAPAVKSADPAALEQARLVVKTLRMQQLIDAMLGPTMQQTADLLRKVNPGNGDLAAKLVMDEFVPEARRRLPDFVDGMAHIYAGHFSAMELRQLNDFYQTPLGTKLVDKLPVLSHEGMAFGSAWGNALAQDVLQRLKPELEKRGLRSPI